MTNIEWTDVTWNPTTGCDRVSPGCDNCYALTMAKRLKAMGNPKYRNDGDPRTSGPGFALSVHPDTLDLPLTWRKPRRVFVNSMSDLFHPDIPDAFIMAVFSTMLRCRRHTYQILTKRPQRLASWLRVWGPFSEGGPGGHDLEHIWLGTSIESDRYVWRANHLREAPGAVVRFLSLEPLLGPLPSLDLADIDWVIVGGESGPNARPMHVDWVRAIRDRCIEEAVPFFFKQWGEWGWPASPSDHKLLQDGTLLEPGYRLGPLHLAHPTFVRKVGKKAAGRELDGCTWDEYPMPKVVAR